MAFRSLVDEDKELVDRQCYCRGHSDFYDGKKISEVPSYYSDERQIDMWKRGWQGAAYGIGKD